MAGEGYRQIGRIGVGREDREDREDRDREDKSTL
jgi:hypothetical protein